MRPAPKRLAIMIWPGKPPAPPPPKHPHLVYPQLHTMPIYRVVHRPRNVANRRMISPLSLSLSLLLPTRPPAPPRILPPTLQTQMRLTRNPQLGLQRRAILAAPRNEDAMADNRNAPSVRSWALLAPTITQASNEVPPKASAPDPKSRREPSLCVRSKQPFAISSITLANGMQVPKSFVSQESASYPLLNFYPPTQSMERQHQLTHSQDRAPT